MKKLIIFFIVCFVIPMICSGKTAKEYKKLGNEEYKKQKYKNAINYYNQAIQLNPEDVKAYYNRGLCYYDLKKYIKSIADYDKAIKFSPEFVKAYNNRGYSYLWAKEYEKAKIDLLKSIELNNNNPVSYVNLGCYYWVAKKNKDKALYYLELGFKQNYSKQRINDLYDDSNDGYFLKGLNNTQEFKELVYKYINK